MPRLPVIRTLAAVLTVAGCTTASFEAGPEGDMRLTFTRVWSDVSFSASPDGTVTYSSSPDAAASQAFSERLVNMLLPLAVPKLQAPETMP